MKSVILALMIYLTPSMLLVALKLKQIDNLDER